jgi:hypothetical protein
MTDLELHPDTHRPLLAESVRLTDEGVDILDRRVYPFEHRWVHCATVEDVAVAIETMVTQFASVPSPHTVVVLDHLGGAISRVGPDETAFPHRTWAYNFLISSAWAEPTDSDRNMRWTRAFYAAMEPQLAPAIYSNYMYLSDEGEQRNREVYGRHATRLAALKAKYDPTNLFRLNVNIKPAV